MQIMQKVSHYSAKFKGMRWNVWRFSLSRNSFFLFIFKYEVYSILKMDWIVFVAKIAQITDIDPHKIAIFS